MGTKSAIWKRKIDQTLFYTRHELEILKGQRNYISPRSARALVFDFYGRGACISTEEAHIFLRKEVYISTEDVYISTEELHISTEELHISTEELHISTEELHISTEEMYISMEEMYISTERVSNSIEAFNF